MNHFRTWTTLALPCVTLAAALITAEPAGGSTVRTAQGTTTPALSLSLPDSSMDAARRQRIIDTLINRLERLYVFPEKVPTLATVLRQRLARGDYDGITKAPAFAESLTTHIRELVSDQHLGVRFLAPRRRLPATPPGSVPAAREAPPREQTGGITKVELMRSNIGYLAMDGFNSVDEVDSPYAKAMNQLAGADALIIDIRANSGGWPHSVALLVSYFVGNDSVHVNSLRFREGDSTMRFYTSPKVSGPKFGVTKPVYILTSSRTFSAAEEFAYDMKALQRATIIGEQTAGGANPGRVTMLDENIAAFVPFAAAHNPITNGNWEGTGVTPDIRVPATAALDRAIEEAQRAIASTKKQK